MAKRMGCQTWRLAGLKLYVSVLITSELIGKVYRRSLEVATDSPHLKTLCRVLVADELAHVGQRVLRHAGYRTRTFLRACDAQYSFYLQSPKLPRQARARAS